MKANLLFPKLLESYRHHLRRDDISHVSLSKFCKDHGAHYKSATQWMRRHGITADSLACEVLVEQFGGDKEMILAQLKSHRPPPVEVPSPARKTRIGEDKLLGHVSITFPDGLQINIRETTPMALSRLINLYNHELDLLHVRAE